MKRHTLGMLCLTASIAACGGGGQSIVGPELFAYSAVSQVASGNPMRFQTTVTIRNPTTDQIEFDVVTCNHPRVFVYSNAARTGTVVWDSNSRAVVCTTDITNVKLAAGASVSYTQTVTGAEVLGPSGAAGTYYIADEVVLSGVRTRVPAGQVNLTR